jgi:protein-disulfide isomerase
MGMNRALALAVALATGCGIAAAQTSVPPNQVSPYKDTSILKPPAGTKVAVIEWEDLECPACAHAFPIVHEAVAKYHLPLERHDFLIPGHIWSRTAAIYARWMQDTFGMDVATDFRRQVFASQFRIASQDDLKQFTESYLKTHGGKSLPFVVDPSGKFTREVDADSALGDKLGLRETPTIIVVTNHHWIQVKDVMQLYTAIDQAQAEAAHEGGAPALHKTAAR